jgi:Na+-driven multidrug efflux pump
METLCGQAYGAGAYTRVGVILQRALLVCWTVCIPVGFLWLNSHALLLQLGQQPGGVHVLPVCSSVCISVKFLWLNSHALLLQLGQQPGRGAMDTQGTVVHHSTHQEKVHAAATYMCKQPQQ